VEIISAKQWDIVITDERLEKIKPIPSELFKSFELDKVQRSLLLFAYETDSGEIDQWLDELIEIENGYVEEATTEIKIEICDDDNKVLHTKVMKGCRLLDHTLKLDDSDGPAIHEIMLAYKTYERVQV